MLDDKKERQICFRACQGLAGLDQLAPEWTALAESLPDARFVHFPEWYRAYLFSLETDPRRVWFIAAYRHERLVAIFPLQFQSYRVMGWQPRVIGTIDDNEMQASDFVFAKTSDNEGLLHALTHWLRTGRGFRWDELRLRRVAEDSAIAFAARARMPRAMVPLCHDGSAYFLTGGTYEEATHAMSGTFRRNLRRLARRAEGDAALRFQSYRQLQELESALETFVDIEASGWKGDKGSASAIRCRPTMLAFCRGLMHEFGTRDACVINLLWHGQQPVAGQFCLKVGTRLNILKIGYSNAHAHFAPGNLLLERTLQDACSRSDIDVVSLVNLPPWAAQFKPLITSVWSYCAPNWNARGLCVHAALLAKRTWDSHHPRAAAAPAHADADAAV